MGDGAGNPQDRVKFLQRSLMRSGGAAPGAGVDPLDPTAVAARQREARRMRDGMNSSFGTSTRGTDLPQGAGLSPGSTGGGSNPAGDPDPIISDMTGRNTGPTVDERAEAERRRQEANDARDRNGPSQRPGTGPRVYRF